MDQPATLLSSPNGSILPHDRGPTSTRNEGVAPVASVAPNSDIAGAASPTFCVGDLHAEVERLSQILTKANGMASASTTLASHPPAANTATRFSDNPLGGESLLDPLPAVALMTAAGKTPCESTTPNNPVADMSYKARQCWESALTMLPPACELLVTCPPEHIRETMSDFLCHHWDPQTIREAQLLVVMQRLINVIDYLNSRVTQGSSSLPAPAAKGPRNPSSQQFALPGGDIVPTAAIVPVAADTSAKPWSFDTGEVPVSERRWTETPLSTSIPFSPPASYSRRAMPRNVSVNCLPQETDYRLDTADLDPLSFSLELDGPRAASCCHPMITSGVHRSCLANWCSGNQASRATTRALLGTLDGDPPQRRRSASVDRIRHVMARLGFLGSSNACGDERRGLASESRNPSIAVSAEPPRAYDQLPESSSPTGRQVRGFRPNEVFSGQLREVQSPVFVNCQGLGRDPVKLPQDPDAEFKHQVQRELTARNLSSHAWWHGICGPSVARQFPQPIPPALRLEPTYEAGSDADQFSTRQDAAKSTTASPQNGGDALSARSGSPSSKPNSPATARNGPDGCFGLLGAAAPAEPNARNIAVAIAIGRERQQQLSGRETNEARLLPPPPPVTAPLPTLPSSPQPPRCDGLSFQLSTVSLGGGSPLHARYSSLRLDPVGATTPPAALRTSNSLVPGAPVTATGSFVRSAPPHLPMPPPPPPPPPPSAIKARTPDDSPSFEQRVGALQQLLAKVRSRPAR